MSLLARKWGFDSVQPGPDSFGFWNMDDVGPLELTSLRTTPELSPPTFWLDETSNQALLRPDAHAGAVQLPHHTPFYFEVVSVSPQRLQLALWQWHLPVSKYQHVMTFFWVPLNAD